MLAMALTALVLPMTAAAATPTPSASVVSSPSPSPSRSTAAAPAPAGDLAASGASVEARTGQTVTVHVGLRNVGNGTLEIIQHGAEGWWTLYFNPPPGTEVTRMDSSCSAVDPAQPASSIAPYGCFVADKSFPPGQSYTYSFDLKVTGRAGRTTGSVRAALGTVRPDSNPANDTAPVVVSVTGPGTTSSPGSGLPVTGAPVLALVAAGALLTAAGVAIVLLTRRRAGRTT
ncbi:hypothetical protein GCM10010170_015340 [Dactylosporangium salmoneum]|uniref:LPXTG-motif cell wall-anchored protein n=2 Tax=Dactylosporangium salmoneum TaxID=53361 RepID=A0ABP5SP22_9ACTN